MLPGPVRGSNSGEPQWLGRPALPISPFWARLSLVSFLAISSGVAANLLYFQETGGIEPERTATKSNRSGVDSDQLTALAIEATRPKAALPAATGKAPRARGEALVEPAAHRVGRFAPTSDQFAKIALPGADPVESRRATIRSIQAELAKRGYEPGAADGTVRLVTRAAVMAYEHDQGLPISAEPSPELLAHLRHGTSAPGAAIGLDGTPAPRGGEAEAVIRSVQQSLHALGYFASPPDGQSSEETIRAIREFEMDGGLVPTGRISGQLVARIGKQVAAQQARR